ncbi:non-canonical purine NTP pyrophosphatase [Candidatus Roizmanbacteria bacterium]|nr:non-canonical purine NTP pyrophosphatase [Candidatus Roizmanbacteria bacterium]
MKPIYFFTGNERKFAEMQTLIPQLKQAVIDLPEIQELDPQAVIRAKLETAIPQTSGSCMVEDTALYLDCLKGLPGPLIKWFLQALGPDGLYELAQKMGNTRAVAKTVIGYAHTKDEISYFEGSLQGSIVSPRGTAGFGWDAIFQPVGLGKTFAEMSISEKNEISMRKIAALQFKTYLQKYSL